MTDSVMMDPLRENIKGEKVVQHHFSHGVDWQVNVTHLLIAVAAVLALLYFFGSSSEDAEGPESEESEGRLSGLGQ